MSGLSGALELITGPLSSISLDDEQALHNVFLPHYSLGIVMSVTVNGIN